MPPRTRTTLKKQAQQERSRDTVDAILKAASHILVKAGFDRASTTRIAARAGVSVGSLYQYFPGKEAVVAELIDRHVAETFATVLARVDALQEEPPAVAVPALVAMLFDAYAVDPALHRVFIEQVPRVGRLVRIGEVECGLRAAVAVYVRAHTRELRAGLDPEVAAVVVVRAVAAVTYAAVVEREEKSAREVLMAETAELALRYLGAVRVATREKRTRAPQQRRAR